MKSLVIAEKPSVARDIARVLHCTQKGNGILEGKDYVVTWALGHLVTLADPEEYDKKYMKWEMSTLPMMPDRMKLVVIRQTGKQYNAVKTQLYRKDINDIIIATDAGREGELVARWILDKADCHKPIRRLWISSVTDKAIKEGFGNLKNGHEYDNLYRAAVARAEADWLVGMNGTRALTCKYNAQLSCGRVQTPTLAMIAKREEEIRAFKPKEYYGITLKAGDIIWTWKEPKSKSFRTFNKECVEKIFNAIRNQSVEVTSITSKEKKTFAPGLYDLTTLQREANQKYGYSAKQTLNIMQRLYENHKVLTYPRTDSRYIGKDIVPTIKERLKACAVGPYRKLAGALMNQPVRANGSFVDDKKVSDHHAIIPTEQFVQLDHMTNEERKIYDMVVRRFLSVLYPPFVYEQVSMEGTVAGELFAAGGKVVKSAGWKDVYENTDDTEDDEDTADDAQTLKDQTIYLYKLFDVTTSNSTTTTNYAYTVNTAEGYKDALVSVLGTPITAVSTDEEFAKAVLDLGADNSEDVQKFANDFTKYALTNNLTATKTSEKLGDVVSHTFTGLDAGYYLVYVTGGKSIQSSLVTVNGETTVSLKTEAPSIEKTADKTTVNIGDVVTYTVKGVIPDTTGYDQYQYIIHDELSTGLDFVNDTTGTALGEAATTVNVKVAFGTDVTDEGTAPTTAKLDSTDNRKMSLDLSAWVKANQTNNKGKEFTVTYYAKVNKNAVVTEKNKARLEYGNKPGETTTTTPSEAKTPTYPVDILKVKKGTNEVLADAHFTLYASTTEGTIDESKPIKVTKEADGKYSYAADQNAADATDDMVTVANKIEGQGYNLHINGLAAGTYYLKETKAPEGYNKLTSPIKVTITKTGDEEWTVSKDGTVEDDKIIDIENSTGSILPSTGGRGAIAFAVIAALLVFGVAVSFIRDKRKEA